MRLEQSLGLPAGLSMLKVVSLATARRRGLLIGPLFGLGLGLMTATLGLTGCKLFISETTDDKYPKMTPEAEAVRIYYSGEPAECQEIFSLGQVQAKAGDFPDPDPQFISPQVHMDVALAWLKVEAAKKGANAVRLLEQKGNHDGTLHIAIGEAFFCKKAY